MSVVCITRWTCVAFCLPSSFAFFLFLGIRGQATHHLTLSLTSHGAMGGVFVRGCVCMPVHLTCVYSIVSLLSCMWINWAWMMMMMVMTTMFIACLVKKLIACVQSMKCDNLFIDSCPVCCISRSHSVFYFTSVGPRLRARHASVCKTLSCG